MMQDLISDALINLVRVKAARDPINRIQGLVYPWNLGTDLTTKEGAVLQSADIDPKFLYITFKEIIKYHMYNTSNVTAYITIIKKYPRKSSKETGYGGWQQRLALFPTNAVNTPLSITTATGGHLIKSKGTLNWGYPDYMDFADYPPTAGANIGGVICPFMPTGGANAGVLMIPRQYGAFTQFFPTDPWPSFIQQNAQNFFNQGPSFAVENEAPLAGWLARDLQTTTDYKTTRNLATSEYLTKSAGSGSDPAYYAPIIANNYFDTVALPSGSSTGDAGQNSQAYTNVNYTGNPTYTSFVNVLRQPTIANRQFFSGNKGAISTGGTDALVGTGPQNDPFSNKVGSGGGAGGGSDWGTHPAYDEMRNTCMRRLFKMYKKRITIAPGKVLRWTLRSKTATINPERDQLIPSDATTTVPGVFTGQDNPNKTMSGWGTDVSPAGSVGGSGGQVECPSMWGPEWPCRTILWSMSVRGQTASRGSAADRAQLMPTELLLKKDHIIKYGVKYSPVTSTMRRHRTERNFLEYAPSVNNYKIQYPIAGVISGGSAATTVSSAAPAVL